MRLNAMQELRLQWARWAEEENKCPTCGAILPATNRTSIPILVHKYPDADGKHEHLPTSFDYFCALCGQLVRKES